MKRLLALLALVAAPAAAFTPDATIPLVPSDCTAANQYIRHDEMVARMAAQKAASPLAPSAWPDGRAVEVYYAPTTGLWALTVVRRVKTTTMWDIRPSTLTCFLGEGDPGLFFPPQTLK